MKEYILILFKFIKKNIFFIILFVAYIVITHFFNLINCPIKAIIGFPCPGCGLTRACFSILRLDFISAFNYNPIVFLLPFILWIIIFKERPIINKIYKMKFLWITILLIVITTFIIRMIFIFPEVPLDYYENNLLHIIIMRIKNIFIK